MVKKIDNKVYYQVAGWMINELNLSGQELICYAIIYSLSQLGQGWYNAGLEYLCTFMQCSQPTASKALKGLQDKGLIDKEEVVTDYGRRVLYYCTNPDERGGEKESFRGVNKKFMDGVNKKFMDNNINNKEDKIINNKRLSNDNQKKEYSDDFLNFWALYDYPKDKKTAYSRWRHLDKESKELAVKAIPAYFEDCARNNRCKQHPATYLNKRTFEDDFNVQGKIAFYDVLPTDSEQEKKFKNWMRTSYPNIENTALPLSYADFMSLYEEYGTEEVKTQLEAINANIGKYKYSDINAIIRGNLEDI